MGFGCPSCRWPERIQRRAIKGDVSHIIAHAMRRSESCRVAYWAYWAMQGNSHMPSNSRADRRCSDCPLRNSIWAQSNPVSLEHELFLPSYRSCTLRKPTSTFPMQLVREPVLRSSIDGQIARTRISAKIMKRVASRDRHTNHVILFRNKKIWS